MGNVQTAYENIENKPVEVQLSYSAEYGDIERLTYLLDTHYAAGKLDIDAAKFSLWTPLFMAAKQGHTECVQKLLDAGAVVDGVNQENTGWTPLWVATYSGHEDCVRLLVRAGANLEAKYPETPVFIAAREDRRVCLSVLLDAGASVDVRDRQNQTPLHAACRESNKECIELLALAGAELDCRDVQGKTPLLCACENTDAACIEVLLRYGANPNVFATSGQMAGYYPMHICASKSKLECLMVLWRYGANPTVVNGLIRPSDLAVSTRIKQYLRGIEATVRSLKDIARLCLRRFIPHNGIQDLQKTYKIPTQLISFLLYEL